MTNQNSPPRLAKMEDLKAILAHAANRPAERQKLVDAPEDVLRQAGLMATSQAVEFLQSIGQIEFNEREQVPTQVINDPAAGSAEI